LDRHHDVATVSAHFVFTFGAVDDVWQAAEEKQSIQGSDIGDFGRQVAVTQTNSS